MSHDLDISELATLKDQFEELRQRASRSDDIDTIFDAEIRRRFGLMISRAMGVAQEKRTVLVRRG